MITFKEKKDHTEETLSIAIEKARELGTSIVIASNTGRTAERLVGMLFETGA